MCVNIIQITGVVACQHKNRSHEKTVWKLRFRKFSDLTFFTQIKQHFTLKFDLFIVSLIILKCITLGSWSMIFVIYQNNYFKWMKRQTSGETWKEELRFYRILENILCFILMRSLTNGAWFSLLSISGREEGKGVMLLINWVTHSYCIVIC